MGQSHILVILVTKTVFCRDYPEDQLPLKSHLKMQSDHVRVRLTRTVALMVFLVLAMAALVSESLLDAMAVQTMAVGLRALFPGLG